MKSGNLNFLEPSGPLQACNGTALLFFYLNVQQSKCLIFNSDNDDHVELSDVAV